MIQGKRVKIKEKGTYNYILACGYQCIQCGEKFVAHIGAPTNEE